MGEIWGRYGRDMGEIWARSRRDLGEIWARYTCARSLKMRAEGAASNAAATLGLGSGLG